MTKLEPTLTNSDLMATERLRELLDERGVEYRVSATGYSIDIGPYTTAYANRSDTTLDVSLRQVTPEQAIAATLGSCNCSNDCTNSERTDVPRLPHFWTHDGVLHIEATRMPTRIVVCEGGTCEFVPKRELDASEDENAKLRSELESVGTASYLYGRSDLKAENAKLRELVQILVHCLNGVDCDECPLNGNPYEVRGEWAACDALRDRMGELGVEVNG